MASSTTTKADRRRQRSWLHRTPFAMILLLLTYLVSNNIHGTTSSSSSSFAMAATSENTVGGVITLNAKNFDSSLRDGKVWLIEFYAPWCGHCTRFASTYEQIATQLHTKQSEKGVTRKVNVAKVDGAAERGIASRFSVQGFPTFFLVDGWNVYKFEGNRSQEALVQFALTEYKNTEPVPFLFGPFGPMGQLRSFLMQSGTWAVGLYENLTKERGMQPLMAMSVLCVGGLVVGLVSIVLVGLLFLPKAKLD